MSTTELSVFLERPAFYHSDGMAFPMVIKGARSNYGRVDLLVTPKNGQGERWVNLSKCTVLGSEVKP